MKLYIFTIVLDGMPFLPMQLNILNQLTCDWRWIIVEGAAANTNCTSWCKKQEPRFSRDGSHQFIMSLWSHPRIRVIGNKFWPGGKVSMCNAALEAIPEPCTLLQMDADELWSAPKLDALSSLLTKNYYRAARFECRYFVGPNLVTIGENSYGNNPGEWLRLWSYLPGMRFRRHEPPELVCSDKRPISPGSIMDRWQTKANGLRFDHWAYVFEGQVAYKESFYGYPNATEHWRSLQIYPGPLPVPLKRFLPWVDNAVQVGKLFS